MNLQNISALRKSDASRNDKYLFFRSSLDWEAARWCRLGAFTNTATANLQAKAPVLFAESPRASTQLDVLTYGCFTRADSFCCRLLRLAGGGN
jgi:hypothetical protein